MVQGTWLDDAKKNSGLLIFLGVLTVIFGIIAIASPYLVGVTVSMFVGILLLGSGVAQIVHAVKSRQWGTGIWGTVIGLLGVAAGLLMIFRPVVGLLSMTLLLAFYFLIDGISEIIAAFKIKPDQGWGWVLFNGVIAVLLGLMIWRQWPISGAWAIGVLVGIHIVFSGWTMVVLGTGARRIAGALEDAVEDAVDYGQDLAEDAVDAAQDVVEKAG
ncbi:MAG: HdeD family acid-resistance protein, partial [Acidobacteriota bacterium]|nr:HdeD family acid-resistance protein [Acidobacteriota bacterium]